MAVSSRGVRVSCRGGRCDRGGRVAGWDIRGDLVPGRVVGCLAGGAKIVR